MKKILLLLSLYCFTSFYVVKQDVYICGASGAKKYHLKEDCRGLNACKHQVVKKTIKEAKDLGLELCGWED